MKDIGLYNSFMLSSTLYLDIKASSVLYNLKINIIVFNFNIKMIIRLRCIYVTYLLPLISKNYRTKENSNKIRKRFFQRNINLCESESSFK